MLAAWTRSMLAATLFAVALLTSGCAGEPADEAGADPVGVAAPPPSATDRQATDPSGSPTSAEIPDALQFEGQTVDGVVFDGASVAGRPVVLWFWAPWCAVCLSQAPELSKLADEYGDQVAFVGIGSLDSEDAIAGFADEVSGVTLLSDEAGELWQRFSIAEQSSFVVLDADGDEVLRTGYSDDDDLADTVADLAG